jgi:hypothetical protein
MEIAGRLQFIQSEYQTMPLGIRQKKYGSRRDEKINDSASLTLGYRDVEALVESNEGLKEC